VYFVRKFLVLLQTGSEGHSAS